MLYPLRIDGLKETPELGKLLASDAVILGIATHCDIADRPLTAQCSVEAIEPQIFPCAEVEAMPRLDARLIRSGLQLDIDRLVRIFGGEVR